MGMRNFQPTSVYQLVCCDSSLDQPLLQVPLKLSGDVFLVDGSIDHETIAAAAENRVAIHVVFFNPLFQVPRCGSFHVFPCSFQIRRHKSAADLRIHFGQFFREHNVGILKVFEKVSGEPLAILT